MLRRLPRILRFIPGTAQDVRAYFLTLQYWLAGSEDNLTRMVSFLIHRYAAGPREVLRKFAGEEPPIEYPDVGVYQLGAANVLSIQLMIYRRRINTLGQLACC